MVFVAGVILGIYIMYWSSPGAFQTGWMQSDWIKYKQETSQLLSLFLAMWLVVMAWWVFAPAEPVAKPTSVDVSGKGDIVELK
jgi:hypothetical protein